MMDFEKYLIFIAASFILCAVPRPDMILLLSRSIAQGKKSGLMTAFGINLGAYLHLLSAILGLSAIIATSVFAFTIVKLAGALYLVYLGIQILRSKTTTIKINPSALENKSQWKYFWQGFWSDVLNPKVAVFYLAFLPQFISPNQPHLPQLLILGVTLNLIGIISNVLIVSFSATITTQLRQNITISSWLNKALGTTFITLGIQLASKRAT